MVYIHVSAVGMSMYRCTDVCVFIHVLMCVFFFSQLFSTFIFFIFLHFRDGVCHVGKHSVEVCHT